MNIDTGTLLFSITIISFAIACAKWWSTPGWKEDPAHKKKPQP